MHNPDNPNCSYKPGWSADSSTDFCSCGRPFIPGYVDAEAFMDSEFKRVRLRRVLAEVRGLLSLGPDGDEARRIIQEALAEA